MEIFVNCQPGLASSENDVPLGELFQYLRNEFAKQRLVVRGFTLDGTVVIPEDDEATCASTPAKHKKLELDVAAAEVVAMDVLNELASKMPDLSGEAVKITELLQTGEMKTAGERLLRLNNTTQYVVQAISSINALLGNEVAAIQRDGKTINHCITTLGAQLGELKTALDEQDFATVGDVLEFDISQSITLLGSLMGDISEHIQRQLEAAAREIDSDKE